MKSTLVACLALVSSTFSTLAIADSACPPPPPACRPVLDAGACTPEAGAAHAGCGQDAGVCQTIPSYCAHAGENLCVGPEPLPTPSVCGDGGCSISADPSRALQHAALPSLLVAFGAVALMAERRRRHPRGR